MKHISRISLPAIAAAVLTLTSCDHKELCFNHPHGAQVEVVFDWRNAPDANPDGMTVYFYNLDEPGSQYTRYDFSGRDGGTISLPVANYEAICVNADNEWAMFDNLHSVATFRAYTRQGDPLEGMQARSSSTPMASGTEHQKVVVTPDEIFSDTVPHFAIESRDRSYRITFYPEDMLCHYSYEVRNCTNLRSAQQISGTLSGMSGEMLLASSTHPGTHSVLPFSSNGDGANRLVGNFHTFGHEPAGDTGSHRAHKMMFYAVLRDGRGWNKEYDVSDQVHNAPDPRHVHIVLDGMEFPEAQGGDGNFDIDVSEWIDEIVEIPM